MNEPERRPGASWLDEVSLATKIAFVATFVAIVGYLIYLIADFFI